MEKDIARNMREVPVSKLVHVLRKTYPNLVQIKDGKVIS